MKKMLALLMALVMVLGMMPTTWAEELAAQGSDDYTIQPDTVPTVMPVGTPQEQLDAMIAKLPAPAEIDSTNEEQVKSVYDQVAAINAFAEENGIDITDNETVNAVIAAMYAPAPLAEPVFPAAGGALSSGTYTLTDNVSLTAALTIAAGQDVVIDLNGYQLSFTSGTSTTMITNKGTLTIRDTNAEASGEISFTCSNSGYKTVYGITNTAGTLNFESGKINITRTAGTSTVYGIYSGTINMTGGELNVSATSQVSTVNAISSAGTVSGGKVTASTVKSTGTANVYSNSTATISGGEFFGKTVSAKVTGGTFDFDPSATVPPYKYTVAETSGSWTVSENPNPENYIDVDGTQYVTFGDALDNVSENSVVKLLKDYDAGTQPISIPAGAKITLDLNGKTLSGSGATLISVKGDLTIKDSATGGKIDHTYTGTSSMYTVQLAADGATVTLNSGAINTTYSGTASKNCYGVHSDENGPITINGGTITVVGNQGSTYGAYAEGAKLTMTGGTVDVTANKYAYGLRFGGNGSEMTGGTVTATSKTSSSYGISGTGTISGGTVKAVVEPADKTAYVTGADALITGGTFEGTTVSAKVTGGTFNFNPVKANIPAFTHKVTDNGNGTWTVSEVPISDLPKNIEVAGQQYATFELAKDAIQSGSTVKLLENYDGGKTGISLPAGVTFDLNDKTLTLDKSVTLSFTGGTQDQPTTITDSQATSHDNAGTIEALMTVGSGYTTFEKVNVDTTAIKKLNTFEIKGAKDNRAYVDIRGIKMTTAATDNSTSDGDFTTKYADITIDDLNDAFVFVLNSNYASTSTSNYHKIFQNEDRTTVTINGGTFNLTESGANHKVYFAYNNASTSLLHITDGEFYFNNGSKNVTDVSLAWNRYDNDSAVTGGKFHTDNTTENTFGTSGYSGFVPTVIKGGVFNVQPRVTALIAGYHCIANPDEETKDKYPHTVKFDAGVKVGTVEYADIQVALDAMADGTETGREIVLLKDQTLSAALSVQVDGVTITKGTHTLTLPEDKAAVKLADGVTMPEGIDMADFEAYRLITGGKSYYSFFAVAAESPGNITLLKNVILNKSTHFAYVTGNCTLNLGEFKITGAYNDPGSYPALFNITGSPMGEYTLTVNASDRGGITADDAYTFHVGSSETGHLVINGGNYYGAITAVNVQNGTATINGGTFKSSPTNFTINCIDDNYKNGTAKISIQGGEFYEFDPKNNQAEGQGTDFLAEGKFTTAETRDGGTWYVVGTYIAKFNGKDYETLTGALTAAEEAGGGRVELLDNSLETVTLPVGVSIKLNEKTVAQVNAPGAEYRVVTKDGICSLELYAAKIGTTYYGTLKAAADAATSGQTIVLVDNNTTEAAVTLKEGVTLDTSGKELENKPLAFSAGYKVVQNGTKYSLERYAVQNGDKYYDSLTTAVSTAKSGDTIVLWKNNAEQVALKEGVKLDTNGFDLAKTPTAPTNFVAVKVGNIWTVVAKPAAETDAKPATADPAVTVATTIPADKHDTVKSVATTVTAEGLADLAVEEAAKITQAEVKAAEAALKQEINVDTGEEIHTYAQTYFDITPTGYDAMTKTLTMDITPMVQTVASTAAIAEDIKLEGTDKNAVVLPGSQEKLDVDLMDISLVMPENFFSAEPITQLFVQHLSHEYRARVTENAGNYHVSFTTKGFSPFTFTVDSQAVAYNSSTEMYYTTLAQAVKEVADEQTIKLVKASAEVVTVETTKSFVLDKDGKEFTGEIKAGYRTSGKTPEVDGDKITFSFTRRSGGGGSYRPSGHLVTSTLKGIEKVYVDGVLVDSKNYTVSGGDVTLKQSFLDDLKAGTHTVKLIYGDRQATGTFTTKGTGKVESAKTFDAGIALYAGMALSSAFGAAYVMKKKH